MRELRHMAGLKQSEFAEQFGMTAKSYQFLEGGPDIALMHRQVLALEALSLQLAIEKQSARLVLPSMLSRIRTFNRVEKYGLVI